MKIDTNRDEHLAFINDNTFTEIVWMKYSLYKLNYTK